MTVALIAILLLTVVLPLVWKRAEHNLECFLFVMGVAASAIAGALTGDTFARIFSNSHLYAITAVTLLLGLAFVRLEGPLERAVAAVGGRLPVWAVAAGLTLALGVLSSVMTAAVAAMVLAELLPLLRLGRARTVRLAVVGALAIGLGAVLTPVGEPLATIAVSRLGLGFFGLAALLARYVLPLLLLLAVAAGLLARGRGGEPLEEEGSRERQTSRQAVLRAARLFLFIVGLELLGAGFRPLVDRYVLGLDSRVLYVVNLLSAVLDNATLAAAELSPALTTEQVTAALLGLLISGGMLIPGNVPNLIVAARLRIPSRRWAAVGVPLTAVLLLAVGAALFVVRW